VPPAIYKKEEVPDAERSEAEGQEVRLAR